MERISEDLQSQKMKSLTAIQCAKAAILLSSLKNGTKYLAADAPPILQSEETREKLMMEVVKLREKLKKLRHCIGITLAILFIVLLIYPIFL